MYLLLVKLAKRGVHLCLNKTMCKSKWSILDRSVAQSPKVKVTLRPFLAHLHFSAEELLLYPRRPCLHWRPHANVRAHVKVLDLQSFCIFLAFKLIKPLTTKVYDRPTSGDCGTSGQFCCCRGISVLQSHPVYTQATTCSNFRKFCTFNYNNDNSGI